MVNLRRKLWNKTITQWEKNGPIINKANGVLKGCKNENFLTVHVYKLRNPWSQIAHHVGTSRIIHGKMRWHRQCGVHRLLHQGKRMRGGGGVNDGVKVFAVGLNVNVLALGLSLSLEEVVALSSFSDLFFFASTLSTGASLS